MEPAAEGARFHQQIGCGLARWASKHHLIKGADRDPIGRDHAVPIMAVVVTDLGRDASALRRNTHNRLLPG